MLWNMYFFQYRPTGLCAVYIGQVEAPTEKAAVMKAAASCFGASGASSDHYHARDPATDDWHRPLKPTLEKDQ
jgi:hypothetical protein